MSKVLDKPLVVDEELLAAGHVVVQLPAAKKRPSALRRAVNAAAEALNLKLWRDMNAELEPARKQHAEAERIEALLEPGREPELLAEFRAHEGFALSIEDEAASRVLKSWQDNDPDVVTSSELMRWADVMKRQMVGEGYLRYFVAAEKNEALTARIEYARPLRGHQHPATALLASMARTIHAGGLPAGEE